MKIGPAGPKDLVTLVGKLEQQGSHFKSLTDNIDTSTPSGRFFFHVMASLAQMERELLSGTHSSRIGGRTKKGPDRGGGSDQ